MTRQLTSCARASRHLATLVLSTLVAGLAITTLAQSPLTPPTNGPRHADPTAHLFTNATLHLDPTQTLERASLLIRNGRIEAINPASPPADARVWDSTGLHIYPAFIDPYVEVDTPRQTGEANAPVEGTHWNTRVTPQRRALDGEGPDDKLADSLRKLGFATAAITPKGGIFRGQAAVVSLAKPRAAADRPPIYRDNPYQSMAFDLSAIRPGGSAGGRRSSEGPDVQRWSDYPDSEMGAIALIRQTLSDADWQTNARATGSTIPPNALDSIPVAGTSSLRASVPSCLLLFSTSDELEALRAAKIAAEFNRPAAILGCGTEFTRLDAIRATKLPFILPLNFPKAPDVTSVGKAESVELRDLMMWEQAPTNPRRLDAAGIQISLTTATLKDRGDFRKNLITAMRHGLTPPRALAALTTTPATLLGVADQLGTIAPGKRANFIIADQDLFKPWTELAKNARDAEPESAKARVDESDATSTEAKDDATKEEKKDDPKPAKIRDLWIDGLRHELSPAPNTRAAGTWTITAIDNKPLDPNAKDAIRFVLDADKNELTYFRTVTTDGLTPKDERKLAKAKHLRLIDNRVAYVLEAKDAKALFNIDAALVDNATIDPPSAAPDAPPTMRGITPMPDGSLHQWTATKTSTETKLPKDSTAKPDADKPKENAKDAEAEPLGAKPRVDEPKAPDAKEAKKREPKKTPEQRQREHIAQIPEQLGLPFGPYQLPADPAAQPKAAPLLAITNVTVWTANAKGDIIENATVLIKDGTIDSISTTAAIPPNATVIDGRGKHLAPGIIDTHSHTGISRGVNESGQAVTAEVRIGDVTDPDTVSWYRQLASGVTAVQSLHGSANAIGGQAQTNKLRWGCVHPDDMHLANAPGGIKFALGENPKQSNWGDRNTLRYPQTRMGVEALIRDRFTAAREYIKARDNAASTASLRPSVTASLPFRRDLELEALAEILEGKRLVHCHSYRQDEILMLCRVAQDFGFKIGTFQHILEGYKVADDIAKNARGASGFTDWWAFKIEVQDAIPQAFPIMHEEGVTVSYNSDSDELARRLNTEAAKGIKYGTAKDSSGNTTAQVTPGEAIKWVTINPAIQLGIEKQTGSIEPGKDADFALWSGPPLSAFSRCERTWVDGRQLFSLEDDAKHRAAIQSERTRLIQKALDAGTDRASSSPAGGGLGGPWQRPTEDDNDNAAAIRRHYLNRLNKGIDLTAHQCGDCGEVR